MPELDEAHQLAILVGPSQVGVGVAQAATLLFQCEEAQHARPGDPAAWEVMPIEARWLAAVGDGMEVEREPRGIGEHHWSQRFDPPLQESLLLVPTSAVRIIGCERLLGENVEPGEQAEGLVEVEVSDRAAALLVEELQRQQGQHRSRGGDHCRAGILGRRDQAVEAQLRQQGREEEDAGHACAEGSPRREAQCSAVRDLG